MSTLSSCIHRTIEAIRNCFASAVEIISPTYCIICGRRIDPSQEILCTRCLLDMPITRFAHTPDNPMAQRTRLILPHIRHASALIFYAHNGWREAIHKLKYQGMHHVGTHLGRLLGRELATSPLYEGLDFVHAVPLHPLRRVYRGYNQSYYIARAVAKELGIPLRTSLIHRQRYNTSQVKVLRSKRWENTKELFSVSRPKLFEEKRVLLIDDVLTTGATTISCAESIIDASPSCQLFIAAIAVSEAEFGMESRRRR